MRPASLSIIIIFAMIPILAILAYGQFKTAFSSEFDAGAPEPILTKFDPGQSLEGLKKEKNPERLEFRDPAGKLKISYDSSWTKAEDDIIKKADNLAQLENEDLLLLLYKVDFNSFQPSYLAVERVKNGNWNDIVATMEQEAKAKNQAMEVLRSDISKNRVSLEIKFVSAADAKNKITTRQWAEILVDGDESYIVLLMTTEQNWPAFEKEAGEIAGSIEFLGQPLTPAVEEQPNIDNDPAAGNGDSSSDAGVIKAIGIPAPEQNN
ncbi:MAG TPA: hypothetical protein P5080_04450 [Candidatus Paceibacterota bacterium]|nr:hypothetical protein [Candidatus Paceibacterota bacterium]HSA36925.1 hypothetical protein [Candidatus Paceibacterota bacterium]